MISQRARTLAITARRTRETHGASVFNNAFTAEDATNRTEGAELCATDHPSASDSNYSATNEGTLALSAVNVETTRVNMTQFTDDRSNKIYVVPDMLLVPRNLEETAYEIINASGKVDTADNNPNFHKGKYKMVVWDFLTDSNNWFFIDSTLMKLSLKWFDRIPLEFKQDKEFNSYVARFVAYMRYSFSFHEWRWVYGQLVA